MTSYLISGGTGSFGRAFTKYLLDRGISERVCIYSRGEHAQADMAEAFGHDERLRWFIGDVRDRDRLRRAMTGADVVVHAAALKRIEVGRYNPIEMVRTNIEGAVNVIEVAQDVGVDTVVGLSTDKAYAPVSPYGQSKALAESLFLAANDTVGPGGPRFRVTRYGNVWWSAGSVGPRWYAMLRRGAETVPVTDPDCTRFFMTMDEACRLVHDAVADETGQTMFIPRLPAYDLATLANAFSARAEITGLPAWEKLHESMAVGNCSADARRMTEGELRDAIAGAIKREPAPSHG